MSTGSREMKDASFAWKRKWEEAEARIAELEGELDEATRDMAQLAITLKATRDFLRSVEVFIFSREQMKQPEGRDMFREALGDE